MVMPVNHKLHSGVMNKDKKGYVFSVSCDLVQTVALFLSDSAENIWMIIIYEERQTCGDKNAMLTFD